MESFRMKTCLCCGKELVGRMDKKFCDGYCRTDYHNKNKSFGEIYISNIQRITRHNRKILKTLCPEGKSTVRKEVLEKMGYDFRQFSGLFKSSNTLYYLVYDFAFAPIWEGEIKKVLIVSRQDYMDKLSFEIWKKPQQA